MTVAELILILEGLDPDASVVVWDSQNDLLAPIISVTSSPHEPRVHLVFE